MFLISEKSEARVLKKVVPKKKKSVYDPNIHLFKCQNFFYGRDGGKGKLIFNTTRCLGGSEPQLVYINQFSLFLAVSVAKFVSAPPLQSCPALSSWWVSPFALGFESGSGQCFFFICF